MRTHYCGEVDETLAGRTIEAAGWVHRRRDHGGVIFVDLRDRSGLLQVVFDPDTPEAFKSAEHLGREFCIQVQGKLRPRPGRHGEREPELRPGRTARLEARDPEPVGDAAVLPRRGRGRGTPAQASLHRPAPRRDAGAPAPPPRDHARDARVPRRPPLRRHRDADADQGDARGRARLPGALAHAPRQVLRAAAVAADLQAAPDDGRLRPLLPDRALLPRRGPARRPPAGIHAARRRDLLPRAVAGDGAHGGPHPPRVLARAEGAAAGPVPAADLCRGHAPLRFGQAGPARAARARRRRRPRARVGVQGVRGPGRRPGRPRRGAARAARRRS